MAFVVIVVAVVTVAAVVAVVAVVTVFDDDDGKEARLGEKNDIGGDKKVLVINFFVVP